MKFRKLYKTIPTLLTVMLAFGCAKPVVEQTVPTSELALSVNEIIKSLDAPTATAKPDKSSIAFGINSDIGAKLNPITTSDSNGQILLNLVYSPLYIFNGESHITYLLAKSLTPSSDGRAVTAVLRNDVKWNDGTPFTADDVVFTYEQQKNPLLGGTAMNRLALVNVKKIDDYTVEFSFPTQVESAHEILGNVFIAPKHIYENETDYANSSKNLLFVGTGAYQVSDYMPDIFTKLAANPNYFLGEAKVKNFVFKVMGDSDLALQALENGKVDVLSIYPEEVERVQKNPNLKIYSYSDNTIEYLAMNMESPISQMKEARHALMYSLDKKEIFDKSFVLGDSTLSDFAQEAFSFLPSKATYYNPNLTVFTHDTIKSQALLKAVKKPDFKFTLGFPKDNTLYATQAEIIKKNAQSCGITVLLMPLSQTEFNTFYESKKPPYDMYFSEHKLGFDPADYGKIFLTNSPSNYMNYSNKRVDQLFTLGKTETDPIKRKAMYDEIQQLVCAGGAFYPIAERKSIIAMNASISGISEADFVPSYLFSDVTKLELKGETHETN